MFFVCANTPGLGFVLQGLQSCLDQIQRLEEQRRAGAAERATHEGFESRVSLRTMTDKERDNGEQRGRGKRKKKGDIRESDRREMTVREHRVDPERKDEGGM